MEVAVGVFPTQPSHRFTKNTPKKRKYTPSSSFMDENTFLSKVRGEWPDYLELIGRQLINEEEKHAEEHL